MKPVLEWVFWYIPEGKWDSWWNFGKCILIFSALAGALGALAGENFFLAFFKDILSALRTVLIWAALLLVPYLISKKKPEKGKRLRTVIHVTTFFSTNSFSRWPYLYCCFCCINLRRHPAPETESDCKETNAGCKKYVTCHGRV